MKEKEKIKGKKLYDIGQKTEIKQKAYIRRSAW